MLLLWNMVNLVAYPGEVVCVTGACGFVGRSLVKIIMEKYENLSELIMLDIREPSDDLIQLMNNPKADSPTVRFIQCDIRNTKEVTNALEGVDAVLHLASVIDTSQTPDMKKLHDVNVHGTKNIVEACVKNSIQILVSTSSTEINRGYTGRVDATEQDVNDEARPLQDLVMPGYSSTKQLGEEVILAANGRKLPNGKSLRTVALRPPGIYGENDEIYISHFIRSGRLCMGVMPILGSPDVIMQRVYVGNVAWAHVHALITLQKDSRVAGKAYNITDGTSTANSFTWIKPFLETQRVKIIPIAVPFLLVFYFMAFLELILWIISPIVTVKLLAEKNHIFMCCSPATYNGNLAKTKLGYRPLFTAKEAYSRSLQYYSSMKV